MTISPLSSVSPSRWGDLSPARTAETSSPKPPGRVEHTEAEREGPHRSPLFGAIKDALTELVAQADPPTDTAAGAAAAPADAGPDGDTLEQALTDFARALMQALREGRGPQGEGRGLHLGHALGRQAWDSAAERVEKLAHAFAPEATEGPGSLPVEAPAQAAAAVTAAPTASVPAFTLTESPWKSAHDGLIESFAEVQRAMGPAGPDSDDDESLEEQLREMLVALAAKLRTTAIHTTALAPPGSLLSVVA